MSDKRAQQEPEPPADLERLRQAFSLPDDETDRVQEAEAELDVDAVWSALEGELEPEARHRLVERLAADPRVRQEWILAQEMWRDAPADERAAATTSPPRLRFWQAAAAAAAVLIAVAGGFWTFLPSDNGSGSGYRNEDSLTIDSLLPAAEAQPRENCQLRWTEIPEARYHLRVTTESLVIVADVEDLEPPRYTLPPATLQPLETGTTLLWRVEASLPSGDTVQSSTFRTTLR